MKLAYSLVAQPKQRTGIAEPDALVVDEDAYRLPGFCSSCRPVHARVATTSLDVTGAQQLPWRCRPASEGRP